MSTKGNTCKSVFTRVSETNFSALLETPLQTIPSMEKDDMGSQKALNSAASSPSSEVASVVDADVIKQHCDFFCRESLRRKYYPKRSFKRWKQLFTQQLSMQHYLEFWWWGKFKWWHCIKLWFSACPFKEETVPWLQQRAHFRAARSVLLAELPNVTALMIIEIVSTNSFRERPLTPAGNELTNLGAVE